MKKTIQIINFSLYTLLSIGVALYAFNFIFQLANPANPVQVKLATSTWVVPIHLILGGLALLISPFQLSHKLRRYSPSIHKSIGYTYFSAVMLSGMAGLIMALNASGGLMAKLGFFFLAVGWLFTTIVAVYHATKGNVVLHKRWIYRSIAFTAAAITFRILLGVFLGALELPFLTFYPIIAWLCWTINLGICEWLLFSTKIRCQNAA